MTTEGFEAWLLHKRPSGDTSLQGIFFTREKGVVTCLCKGARASKKQTSLQPFAPLWLTINVKRDFYFVCQIESLSNILIFQKDSLFASFYLNELVYSSLSPMDPYPQLFDIYTQTLRCLATTTNRLAIEVLLRQFEWSLLVACGSAFSWLEEARSAAPIEAQGRYYFVANEGFVAANEGAINGSAILAFAEGCLEDISTLKTAKFIMRQAVDHLLNGKVLKSRSLFNTLN